VTGGKGRRIKRHETGPPSLKVNPRRKQKVDIDGLAREHDYWSLKALVLARPQGGDGSWRHDGAFRLTRAGLCEKCGRVRATDAHHRKPVAQGGPDVASNLAALCRTCHDWCHGHPAEAVLGGWIVRPHDDFRSKALLLWDGSIAMIDDDANYSFQQWPSR
jgi:hypothetical protein